jgi:hypothetical protein
MVILQYAPYDCFLLTRTSCVDVVVVVVRSRRYRTALQRIMLRSGPNDYYYFWQCDNNILNSGKPGHMAVRSGGRLAI